MSLSRLDEPIWCTRCALIFIVNKIISEIDVQLLSNIVSITHNKKCV